MINYGWIFSMLQDVLPDITGLTFGLDLRMDAFADLYPMFSQLNLPSLNTLKISVFSQSDAELAYMFTECFLAVAARSKVDQLSLGVSCQGETIVEVLNRNRIFSRVKSLRLHVCE
jgi:hypothetical protein